MSIMRTDGAGKIVLLVTSMLILGSSAYARQLDEGVRVITQEDAEVGNVTAGDAPGFPVTISESDSYRLGSNMTLLDGDTTGIEITAGTVTLDLNGFSIVG